MSGRPPHRGLQALAYVIATVVSLLFLYPYWWMLVSAFRPTRAIMSDPLRLWPERFDLSIFTEIGRVGGVELWVYVWNSLLITSLSTLLSVVITSLGAYALVRRPDLPGFRLLRYGFLVTIMYPYMLLVIPVYLVMFKLGLLGSYAGIILFLALGPIQFFLFEQFFRATPGEVIEAGIIDGANELQVLFRIVLPMAAPITATVALITFLLNWSQWFPILVISRSPDTYTLPVALLSMNSELGSNFQGIMALAVLTTLPVAVLFLLAQKRVMEGMASGAVKG
ncbi:MAG: carbohydrate ABC transporter permease [Methylocystis sp.]|nr:carbohydrate ABC transporter permease [Methylocystis sp.]MCA3582606.1 carbohydrate ABC transporter permease [Methylocystis sp.]MCA3589592.1 carbohydrate ABC transporter permease [Methylocystis sp.]MCA3591721.1 carbohydrate ABC transporter permease [Methylocystis sp.]